MHLWEDHNDSLLARGSSEHRDTAFWFLQTLSTNHKKNISARSPNKLAKPTAESKRQWQNGVLISMLKDGALPGLS